MTDEQAARIPRHGAAESSLASGGERAGETGGTTADEQLLPLTPEELDRLPALKPGTELEAGGVYFDLNAPERGPFKALAGQVAGTGNRYVARRDVEYDLWNRLVEQSSRREAEPEDEVAAREPHTLTAPYEQEL